MNKKIARSILISTLLAFTLMLTNASIAAESDRNRINVSLLGPQVGEQVPDFSLPDQNGVLQNLDSIMGPNGAMLLFHRSADW